MSAGAWVLSLADGQRVAVGEAELVHLLADAPREFAVPLVDGPCKTLVLWEGRPTPLAELASAVREDAPGTLLAIVAYEAAGAAEPSHGAIRISAVPIRQDVRDAEAAPPEQVPGCLRPHVHAAFRDAQGVVPVLDLQALFGGEA